MFFHPGDPVNIAQALANMAWSFATMNLADDRLFTAVAKVGERLVSDFVEQALSNMACWPLEGNRAVFRKIHMENPLQTSGS